MQENTNVLFTNAFEEDIYNGLTKYPKQLSSKYFYDANGDKLFQDIMKMPEYYLTDCEFSILEKYKEEISALFYKHEQAFSFIELGAGDGKKTKILLEYFSHKKIDFKYQPIDISQNALDLLEKSLNQELPNVTVEKLQGSYFDALNKAHIQNDVKKIILFLGSNIGNMLHHEAIDFLNSIGDYMHSEDLFLVGFDLKKNPQTILDAYNDPTGITAAFNKNILLRINTSLDANFNLDAFKHWETYNPETGTAKSYLVSTKDQEVTLKNLDLKIEFKAWETIHTEVSQKYDDQTVEHIAKSAGLEIVTQFSDEKTYYKNYIFRKQSSNI
ncbi:L-histidine N(alpha)-methyltransferase [uncultured Maribacter sp.]|uniref:L-histidine N(alpha)-methyltransferase n=1 Tax=uncultured Maribacter sp. TaxID=431308 RepID=UPI002603E519|nr:L-histidine N(alpha)-methyltransferase [uncultured Maribacter sp.]